MRWRFSPPTACRSRPNEETAFFPVSDKAADIIDALFTWIKRVGVIIKHTAAERLVIEGVRLAGVQAGGALYPADRVIVATGGVSYPQTGSTGDGYRFAKQAGHTVVPPNPSLVPLVTPGGCEELMGLSLRNVQVTVFEDSRRIWSEFGEMLFTHFGLSGPLILSASAHMRHFGSKGYHIEIDLKPALDEKTLDKRLLSDFGTHKNSDFINALGGLLPRKLIPAVVRLSQIDPHAKVNGITRQQRAALLHTLKHFLVVVSGKRPVAEAIVTSGGVSVREVDPKPWNPKSCPGCISRERYSMWTLIRAASIYRSRGRPDGWPACRRRGSRRDIWNTFRLR